MSVKCNRVRQLLSSHLDRQLAAAQGAEVARHLEQCSACRAELAALNADREALKTAETPAVPLYLWTRVMAEIRGRETRHTASRPVWVRVLATAAAIIVITGSACAGVALGSGLARFQHQSQEVR